MVIKKTTAKKSAAKKVVVKKVTSKGKIADTSTKVKKASAKVAPKATVKKLSVKKTTKNSNTKSSNTKKVLSDQAKKTRVTKRTLDQTDLLLEAIVNGLEEKKAKNIVILDLRDLENRVSDYFVIAEGDSNTHTDAISGSVEEIVKKTLKERPYHIEGVENSEWIIIDYVNIVVHVFQREARSYYRLEELWADAKIKKL